MKKILAIVLTALLMLSVLSMSAFATDAPEEVKEEVLDYIDSAAADMAEQAVYSNIIEEYVYIKFGADKANDGRTPETPKPNLGAADGDGTAGVLAQFGGGILVATGKLYVGATYSFPTYEKTLMVTSNNGVTDFKNPEPTTNPNCALKIKLGATCTFTSDTIIDDIILFNEHDNSSATIAITNNSTMVIGENVVSACNTNPDYAIPCHLSLYVEEGSTLIVRGGTFDRISGGGNVYIADSVVVENKVKEIKTDENGMIIPDIVVTRPVIATEEEIYITTAFIEVIPEPVVAIGNGSAAGVGTAPILLIILVVLLIIIALIICLAVYFVPSIIAFMRHNSKKVAILLINIFLGWSGIAWIITLIWAIAGKKD